MAKEKKIEDLGLNEEQLVAVQAMLQAKETELEGVKAALKEANDALTAEKASAETTAKELEDLKAAAEKANVRVNPTFETKEGKFEIVVPKFVFTKDGEGRAEFTAEKAIKDKSLLAQLVKAGAGVIRKV